MVTTQIKELATARENLAHLQGTIATELPQELSRLPEQYGFSDVNSSIRKAVKSAVHGGGRKKAGRPEKAAAGPKIRKRAVSTTPGFTEDDHPTILAATRGFVQ